MTTRPPIWRLALLILLGLGTLELCARLDDWVMESASFWRNYNHASLYFFDSLGMRGKPFGRYAKWRLNSAGYRGPEMRPGTFRIACIGSSETFGLYEDPGKEWPRQLEQVLSERLGNGRFEVVNTSYPGMAITTARRRLDGMIAAVHPRVAIIYPSVAPYIFEGVAFPSGDPAPPPPEPFEFRLAARVETIAKQILPDLIQHRFREWQLRRAIAWAPHPMDRIPQSHVDKFRSHLDDLVLDLRGRGVEPVLVTHATRFGGHVSPSERRLLGYWRRFYPQLREDGFLDMEQRLNDALRGVAAARGMRLVDAAQKVPPGPRYFAEFVHFTNEGAHALASLIADAITCLETQPPSCLAAAKP